MPAAAPEETAREAEPPKAETQKPAPNRDEMERRKKEWALRHAAAQKARAAIDQAQREADEARKEVEERRRQAKVEGLRKAEQRDRAAAVKIKTRLGHDYVGGRWRIAAVLALLAVGLAFLSYAGALDVPELIAKMDIFES